MVCPRIRVVPVCRPHLTKAAYRTRVAALLVPLVALGGCVAMELTGRATDEWTHTYPLSPGGEVRVANTNGRVEVQGIDGSTVEIRAERIARATTDSAARELLPRIKIREEITPGRVAVETERLGGIMIGAGVEVRYHVRAPKDAVIRVSNTNGTIALSSLGGKVDAHTTNGGVTGRALTGGVDASVTNGGVNIDVASVGADRISLKATNGGVTLTLPEDAKADVTATCTNGGINVSGVRLEVSEQSRRRVEGRMNGGGTPIELATTNGGVRIRSRASSAEDAERRDR
jgi:hypothetical protein